MRQRHAGLAVIFLASILLLACAGDGHRTQSPTPSRPPVSTSAPSASTVPTGRVIDLSTVTPLLTVLGADSQDFVNGVPTLTSGDFNGDAIPDILLGAPLADGPDNDRLDAGEAYVIFGGANLAGTLDLASREQNVIVLGGSPGDNLGFSVAAADLNADGLDDVVVGAPGVTGNDEARTDQGEIYVIFGSTDLAGEVDIPDGQQAFTITGAEGFSRVGHAIATGDVNADGVADIIAGAPFAGREPGTPPGGKRTTVGEVYVVFGRAGLMGRVSIPRDQQDFTLKGKQSFGQFGAAVNSGDVNGDKIDDIVIGAPLADGLGASRKASGEVYVVFGGATLAGKRAIAEGGADLTIPGADPDDNLGYSLAVDNVTGDDVADIITAARQADGPGNGRLQAGEVYVFAGSPALGGTLDPAAQAPTMIVYGATDASLLPSSLATGDANDDGVSDLLLATALGGAGVVYLILGPLPPAGSLDLATEMAAIVGRDEDDYAGSALAIADINGDGLPEILLLASGADGPDNGRPELGELYAIEPAPP